LKIKGFIGGQEGRGQEKKRDRERP
jgi:hypothetical protein